MKTIILLIAVLVEVSLPWVSSAQEVLTGDYYAHDPSTINKDGSRYYFFRTDYGISINWSDDLYDWHHDSGSSGKVFPSGPPAWTTSAVPGFTGGFWAPDVAYFNGEYHLYYSCSSWGSQDSAIGLVTTPSLSSPSWVDQGLVIESNPGSAYNCIDPSILVETNGNVWMTFGSYWNGIYLVQLNPTNGLRIASDSPTTQLAWNSSIEASCLYQRGSYYYLFVNHGSCCSGVDSTYNIRVGRSTSITGPYLDRHGVSLLSGGGTLLLGSYGPQIGPGHAGIISEGGVDWLSYHYYDGNESGNAKLGLRQLQWTSDGWPEVRLMEGPFPSKPSVLMHRWSFNETSGTSVTDSVGGAHGTVIGAQYAWTGTELNLVNSGSAAQSSGAAETDPSLSYVDLPNGIFSTLSNAATFELWYTYNGGAGASWQRTLDIGIADTGIENDVGLGSSNLFMTCRSGADVIRWAGATDAPGYNNEFAVGEIKGATVLAGDEHHMVLTYDSDDGYAYLYLDGVLDDARPVHWALSNLPDVNNWIGRSQYAADPLLNGSINELRVYNGVMTPSEVAAHMAAGPDATIEDASLTILPNGDGTLTVSWPLWASGSVLEFSPVLGPQASWNTVAGTPVEEGGFLRMNGQAGQTSRFYRLRQ